MPEMKSLETADIIRSHDSESQGHTVKNDSCCNSPGV